jgi:nitrogen-specific signal transduction histidine kinase/CheY-like chemotaxis protein
VGRDVTHIVRLEKQLRQAQKMEAIGTLAGGIAHDFNNILTIIIGYAEILLDGVSEENPMRVDLEEVLKAGFRARGLVEQILTFSRQTDQERRPLQIAPIVKEALKLLRASIPKTIEIRENIATESGMILADPTQIHQVLMNLCTNSAHAMREKGGRLEVGLIDVHLDYETAAQYPDLGPGPYLRLTVSDTGHGMERTVRERIFDPFFTTKGPGEGTGLGLAMVYGIVKSHRGEITVYSEPGKGTTFHVFLPKVEVELIPSTEPLLPLSQGKERILFVDDEEGVVQMGRKMLERLGYEVIISTDGREALEIFRSQPEQIDLVITDQTMPNITGAELAQELMRIRPDIPVILCSGFSELIDQEKAKAMGIREFVMKPIITRDIGETIRRVLEGETS